MSKLVIVESPSKSKSLKKYLGADYDILASYGHVRDLEPKTGAVDTETFGMKYQIIERNAKHVEAIVKAAKKADEVLLATDPDREGEAISWHISEILKERKIKTPMKRVAFYEITESAIQDAVRNPREIASDLVDAQQARRALDYLVGFNLSPLLWKKISPGLSAGRVQSPALRMIVEREEEIEAFVAREYWTLHLDTHKGSQPFTAKLTHFRGEKLDQFTVEHEARSKEWLATLEGRDATVMRIEKKRRARNPVAPFTTSTLQQAGVRQLGMTTDRVMRTAQQLYEGIDLGEGPVGLITYMRTDSVNLAQEAITEIRKYVGAHFDREYLPATAVQYKAKTKNAQEAHEAVRPTSVARTPQAVKPFLTHDQARLYELIWTRSPPTSPSARARFARPVRRSRFPASSRSTRTTRRRRASRSYPRSSKARRCRSTGFTANSTSPSRRRVTPRRASSRRSRNTVLAARRPTPASSRRCRIGNTSCWRRSASSRPTSAASSTAS
jgi:DNA topoisomerase-1